MYEKLWIQLAVVQFIVFMPVLFREQKRMLKNSKQRVLWRWAECSARPLFDYRQLEFAGMFRVVVERDMSGSRVPA